MTLDPGSSDKSQLILQVHPDRLKLEEMPTARLGRKSATKGAPHVLQALISGYQALKTTQCGGQGVLAVPLGYDPPGYGQSELPMPYYSRVGILMRTACACMRSGSRETDDDPVRWLSPIPKRTNVRYGYITAWKSQDIFSATPFHRYLHKIS